MFPPCCGLTEEMVVLLVSTMYVGWRDVLPSGDLRQITKVVSIDCRESATRVVLLLASV